MGGCLEDQGCQEAGTAIQDVFASICLATWGLEALGCPQCHQRAPDLDLVPQDLLPLVAMEQDALRCVRQFLTRFAVRMETPTAMSASLKLLRVTLLMESFSPPGRYVHTFYLVANKVYKIGAQFNRKPFFQSSCNSPNGILLASWEICAHLLPCCKQTL